jgi:2-desacetyl-2-hydroxyethyl bacteriochlorophyllide A dehydrogenase
MRAFVITGPRRARVEEVDEPDPGPGQVTVDVERVGLCGTDVELFTGTMPYFEQGHASYPLRPGHEWAGAVSKLGPGVDAEWLGVAVTADTELGCGACERCLAGRNNICADRYEIGIRGGWPGALAERLLVPVSALYRLPQRLAASAGALVEPGGCAFRAVQAGGIKAGMRVCVWGPGTLGLLALQFAVARGASVDVVGVTLPSLRLARELGAARVFRTEEIAGHRYDVVIDATNSSAVPRRALEQVEPGGTVVLVGLADEPSTADLRDLVLADVTVVGILAGSAGLRGTIDAYASGQVQTDPLIAETVGLDDVAEVLGGNRRGSATAAPKVQVDPRR